MIKDKPRVRFAPSPTGYLHVGGLRTALYNYLFAKHNEGTTILRIEDTDKNRYVEGAVDNLLAALDWVGLEFDEGPKKGGSFGPYLQSQRFDIYHKYAKELIERGNAYYAFDTPERLEKLRKEQLARKEQPKYDKLALTLSREEVNKKLENGEPYVIRMNVEPGPKVVVNDRVRGRVEFDREIIDDQILIKSDGYPTYHLANLVDDHLMKITHVIRGEEWLSSTPKHVLLYEFFDWGKPEFAHLPLLLNSDKTKLSKRQGDVTVEDYQHKGYLPEALLNFVALLGWNAGDDKEFYELSELIEKFTLERVNKAGAVFDVEKLNWLNGEHLRNKSNEELLLGLKKDLTNSKYAESKFSDEFLLGVIEAMKPRVEFVKEYLTNGFYFFEPPQSYDEKAVKKRWKEDTPEHLNQLREAFAQLDNPSKEDFEQTLRDTAESLGIGAGKLIHPVRLATSGVGGGPGVFDLLYLLGNDEVIKRIDTALENIQK